MVSILVEKPSLVLHLSEPTISLFCAMKDEMEDSVYAPRSSHHVDGPISVFFTAHREHQ